MVASNKCIASQWPYTYFEFEFTLAKLLFPQKSNEIENLKIFMGYKS